MAQPVSCHREFVCRGRRPDSDALGSVSGGRNVSDLVSLVERFPSWGLVLCNGIVTLLLGIAILQERPASGLWVLGMFVGIDLMMNGVTWSILAVGINDAVTE